MKFVDNWQAVLKHAWSVRLILLAVLMSAIEAILPFIEVPVSPGIFAMLSGIFGLLAGFSRLVAQQRLQKDLLHWESGDD